MANATRSNIYWDRELANCHCNLCRSARARHDTSRRAACPMSLKYEPFLKWAGGKRSSAEAILEHRPAPMSRYIEPFLGGGAVFFALRSSGWEGHAILADINTDLMIAYEMVRDRVEELIEVLSRHVNTESAYYVTRSVDPSSLPYLDRAARLIYLNKTAFNGLWRENKSGKMNAPFGHYLKPTLCDSVRLRQASQALQNTTLLNKSFSSEFFCTPTWGDFVYCDPPYLPLTETANYTSYHSTGFNLLDQEKLASMARLWAARGARVALSNADVPLAHKLYDPGFGFVSERLQARRSINSKGEGRGKVGEALFVLDSSKVGSP